MTLRVDVLTIFPEAVEAYASTSVLGRARDQGLWALRALDLRDATTDVHRSVDDAPFGGGPGMVMSAEPVLATVAATPDLARPLIALSASGPRFTQSRARDLSDGSGFSLLCGRYEGLDQRAIDLACDAELSVGDFVLAGGELAALCVVEAVVRLLPGALGNDESSGEESFVDGLLEYPQYTRPAEVRGVGVPEVLRSGDHAAIARWRRAQALARTLSRRPDLIAARGGLSDEEAALVAELGEDGGSPAG
ncbi:MAG TPA: tRNA (guanosine(37)-N1)-methyltransferase TrmD [Acidimicrobiales bacterium]|nr:tRNA (guanosine(37)-N1)-methyltransferase TrmD [Acidimicrobiales bacterium]